MADLYTAWTAIDFQQDLFHELGFGTGHPDEDELWGTVSLALFIFCTFFFFFAFSLVLESVVHHTGDNLHGHVSVHTQVYVGYFKCFRMPLCDMTPCYFVFRNTTVCVWISHWSSQDCPEGQRIEKSNPDLCEKTDTTSTSPKHLWEGGKTTENAISNPKCNFRRMLRSYISQCGTFKSLLLDECAQMNIIKINKLKNN